MGEENIKVWYDQCLGNIGFMSVSLRITLELVFRRTIQINLKTTSHYKNYYHIGHCKQESVINVT